MLLGEVEVDAARLVQHQPIVLDRRDMAVGIDLEELGRPGVDDAGGRRIGQAVELHDRDMLEGEAEPMAIPVMVKA